jgi:hypothetical protein
MKRVIHEPHGEPKYLSGPDGVLCYRITSDKLTRDNPDRAGLWARIEADVLARNEAHPVDMYTWAIGEREDGSEFEDLVRVRFTEDWTVASIEQVK